MSLVSFRTISEPTEPLLLTDVKNYLRIDFTDDDTVISRLISAARKYAENVLNRALATQTIQAIHTIEPAIQGTLYGPIDDAPNWYHYQEELGANPFGVSQFYFDLPMPPLQSVSLIENQLTVFDNYPASNWNTYTGVYVVDNLAEPGRVYFQTPPTAYRWRFTYVAGYGSGFVMPYDLQQVLFEIISFWYDNREGDKLPDGLVAKLQSRRQITV